MKVVLFAGGRGLRMRDGAADVPKPLSLLAGRPLLWHLMSWYAAQGHCDFVVCVGYRAQDVRTVVHAAAEPGWNVECVDTGLDTPIGQRLAAVRDRVQDQAMFLANYADVLSNVRLDDMIDRAEATDAAATMLVVRPQSSFHLVDFAEDGRVRGIGPVTHAPMWQNAGFFVLRQDVFDVIGPGEELVDQPFARLAAAGRLQAHPWEGFWAPLDTQKDRQRLEDLHSAGLQPWTSNLPRLVRTTA